MSWIKLSGLSGYMYKHKILVEIGGLVGKVAKLYLHTNNRIRGRFARMAVYVNLDKPLVSQILINGKIQKDEFLPTVYFHCGRYGHMKDVSPFRVFEPKSGKHPTPSETLLEVESINVNDLEETSEIYEPWMVVEKKSWRKPRDLPKKVVGITKKKMKGPILEI
ncbi:hypothetical protein J1N35_037480 [Gossypium stocksii]|uniref:DUF4283 domain-containing protein n=1 Tax=Gossypium stocksii TaxID=47602 RepID=A0A9D3ZKZ0_9ROSI|nr:hypothetical protein J1N35_037480 [Gossypium stocksii]